MSDFRDLPVWRKSHYLTLAVYRATKLFPLEELFGLTSQMQRSAALIPVNIALGWRRTGSSGANRFLEVAMGSANELRQGSFMAHQRGLLSQGAHEKLTEEIDQVKRLLKGLLEETSGRRTASAGKS
jgi:four helix bundle protein